MYLLIDFKEVIHNHNHFALFCVILNMKYNIEVKDGKRIPFVIQALQYFINNQVIVFQMTLIDLKMNKTNASIHPIDISVL